MDERFVPGYVRGGLGNVHLGKVDRGAFLQGDTMKLFY